MKKKTYKVAVRYVVKANGREVDTANTASKAWYKAHVYAEHCYNQDEPFSPKMTVEKEELYEDEAGD